MSNTASSSQNKPLTEAQKARIERNRIKALHLKQAKLISHPYTKSENSKTVDEKIIKVAGTKFVDSGGGFLIEESVVKNNEKSSDNANLPQASKSNISDETLAIPITYYDCLECGEKFIESILQKGFDYLVCDKCRDPDEKHSLITRTEAKQEYLLKDCDLDGRQPTLKCIKRKNPHNVRWGDMKLYLHLQIEERALEVWGSEEEILRQREERVEKREVTKIKKFNKKMKALRMDVRSSLYDKTTAANHTHEFGPDTYNEEDDNYTHSCLSCQYVETFEKM